MRKKRNLFLIINYLTVFIGMLVGMITRRELVVDIFTIWFLTVLLIDVVTDFKMPPKN